MICPVDIKDVIYSEEKGLTVNLSGKNAFVKFLVVKKDGKEMYSMTPSELYFVCDGQVYTMIAIPARIPAQTVQLVPGKAGTAKKNIELYGELPFEKKIITIVKRVYTNDVPDSFTKTVVGRKMDIFKDLDVILRSIYAIEGEGLRVKEFEVRDIAREHAGEHLLQRKRLPPDGHFSPSRGGKRGVADLEEGRNVARLRGRAERGRTAMKEKLVKIWGTLRPEQRKKSIIAGVLIVLTVVAFGIYKSTRGSAPPPPPSAKREINLGAGDKDVLEKSLYNESTKVIDDMKSQMEDLQKQLKAVQEAKETPEAPSLPLPNSGSGKNMSGLSAKDKGRLPVPEPPPMPAAGKHPRRLSLRAFRRRRRSSPECARPFPAQ